jgi:hypothetical protein
MNYYTLFGNNTYSSNNFIEKFADTATDKEMKLQGDLNIEGSFAATNLCIDDACLTKSKLQSLINSYNSSLLSTIYNITVNATTDEINDAKKIIDDENSTIQQKELDEYNTNRDKYLKDKIASEEISLQEKAAEILQLKQTLDTEDKQRVADAVEFAMLYDELSAAQKKEDDAIKAEIDKIIAS